MKRSLLASLLLAACVNEPGGVVTGTGSDGKPIPGSIGQINVRDAQTGKIHEVTYVVDADGDMMYEGDIDFGPVPDPRLRGEVIVGMNHRWPSGIVHFVFAANVPTAMRNLEIAAMNDWMAHVPAISFIPGQVANAPVLQFSISGKQDVSFTDVIGPNGIDPGDVTGVHIFPTHTQDIIEHELGHALGLDHEAKRSDMTTVLSLDSSCVESGELSQYVQSNPGAFVEPFSYDVNSIMEYPSDNFCVKSNGTDCDCFPLMAKGHSHVNTAGGNTPGFVRRPVFLSQLDTAIMAWMYEPAFGQHVANHQYGAAVVAGDFDGDGIDDVAIGAPNDGWPGLAQAGAVYIYRGVPGGGLVAWNKIAETDIGGVPRAGDHFGASLAVADFDGDGADDLIVGAPHSATTDFPTRNSGVAYVLFGDPSPDLVHDADGRGLSKTRFALVSQTTQGVTIDVQDGAGFGTALATGKFDGPSGTPGLAVGVPNQTFNGAKSGYVNTFEFVKAANPTPTNHGHFENRRGINEPTSAGLGNADQFGASLAVGNFDHDSSGRVDLAIGAPGHGAGTVFVVTANATDWDAPIAIDEPASNGETPHAGDRFGADIAVGNFDGVKYAGSNDGKRELAIGAPGHASNAGRLHVHVPVVTNGNLTFNHTTLLGTAMAAGEQLGGVLVTVPNQTTGFDDIAAGTPLDDIHGTNAGMVWVFRGGSGGLSTATGLGSWQIAGQEYGNALAVRRDGTQHLVAGVIGNDNFAGAFDSFRIATPNVVDVRDETTHTPL
ncbi:MAG: M12 family metallopeptidase [Kofleriaceae bacterium]